MRSRFNRCKTPMGAVPISVIMGFDYPLEDRISGRGESAANYSTYTVQDRSNSNNSSSAYTSDYSNSYNYNSVYDQSNNESNKRSIGSRGFLWPSTLRQAEETASSRFDRAKTEALETLSRSRDRYLRTNDPSEHPKQQPCSYPTALSAYSNPSPTVPRYTRATTVGPSVVSPWRSAGSSGYTSSYRSTYWSSSPASRTYYSSVRSRFL